jgi:hypothetical protein
MPDFFMISLSRGAPHIRFGRLYRDSDTSSVELLGKGEGLDLDLIGQGVWRGEWRRREGLGCDCFRQEPSLSFTLLSTHPPCRHDASP